MSTLDKALIIACEAHNGQKDRFGRPYILHPVRVMMKMRTDTERIVAVLHDVIEDSSWTLGQLTEEGFSSAVVAAVDRLTKRENEPYPAYIERIKADPLAVTVKIADLEDNMDVTRYASFSTQDKDRLERYHRAWEILHQDRDTAANRPTR